MNSLMRMMSSTPMLASGESSTRRGMRLAACASFNGGLSTLVAGDMVAGVGTILLDPPEGNLHDYLESLSRLAALNPSRLLPAHGPCIENGTDVLRHYIDHRHMRTRYPRGPSDQSWTDAGGHNGPHHRDLVPEAFLMVAARQVLCHLNWLESGARWCAATTPSTWSTMSGYFITGTDTEVGKSVVTAALAAGFRAQGRVPRAVKPLASGSPPPGEDASLLAKHAEHDPVGFACLPTPAFTRTSRTSSGDHYR